MTNNTQRPVLIVDSANLFIRSWAAFPTMSSHGYQMGGCIGFLKTLSRIVSEVQPRAVYVAWEGGGSSRRRSLFSEYKLNRRPEKLNRFYEDDIPESEENRKHQMFALLEMLKALPVCQLYASDCEGDDVIAYLCTGPLRSEERVIVSSDKDLYQLLDDRTRMYSLHKKTYVVKDDVFSEYRITSKNFAIAKALCGDVGDNVPGVKGLGFKTAAKLFPLLGTDTDIILQDVFDYSHTHVDESKFYQRIIDSEADVRRNWKMVYLDGGMVPINQATRIDHVIGTFEPTIDRMRFTRCLIKEGIVDFDIEGFLYAFKCIDGMQYTGANK